VSNQTVTNQKTSFDADANSDYKVESEEVSPGVFRQVVKTKQDTLLPDSPNTFTVDITSVQILPANPNRRGLIITNISDNEVFLSFGSPAILNAGIALLFKGSTFNMSAFEFTTANVRAITTISSNITIQEFVFV
jgi:hypothetical protein